MCVQPGYVDSQHRRTREIERGSGKLIEDASQVLFTPGKFCGEKCVKVRSNLLTKVLTTASISFLSQAFLAPFA
jgi:hypothetical protein